MKDEHRKALEGIIASLREIGETIEAHVKTIVEITAEEVNSLDAMTNKAREKHMKECVFPLDSAASELDNILMSDIISELETAIRQGKVA